MGIRFATGRVREGTFDAWVTGWELEAALGAIDLGRIDEGFVWVPAADALAPFAAYVHKFFALKQGTPPKHDRRYKP
jgi:hypothetical protein